MLTFGLHSVILAAQIVQVKHMMIYYIYVRVGQVKMI